MVIRIIKEILKTQKLESLLTMGSLQPQSRKIKKRSKRSPNDPQNFVCGECNKSYKFYPGLYLHIRNKHNGIRPFGTKIIRPSRETLGIQVKAGRPKRVRFIKSAAKLYEIGRE